MIFYFYLKILVENVLFNLEVFYKIVANSHLIVSVVSVFAKKLEFVVLLFALLKEFVKIYVLFWIKYAFVMILLKNVAVVLLIQ